jgi:putative transposase
VGRNRQRKAARRVAAIHEQIANQRLDFWHKMSRSLVGNYDTTVIENLNLRFMTRNGHLALSAHDAALGTFRQLLTYKAEEAGRQLVPVNPKGTSQACSVCGVVVRKNLSVRVHRCDCGLILDRDVNAARNILKLARTGPSGHNLDAGSGAPRSSPL